MFVPKKIQSTTIIHKSEIIDYYQWLRDPTWPNITNQEILSYIKAENDLTKDFFYDKEVILNTIITEIKEKISITDCTVPYLDHHYLYYSYITESDQYWMHARRLYDGINNNFQAEFQDVFLNENALAQNSKHFDLHTYTVSPCHTMVAYSIDRVGDQRYDIIVQDIESEKIIDIQVTNTMGDIVWHENSKGFFYIPANEFWRAEKVIYYTINDRNTEIFHETDYTYTIEISKSTSKGFIFITSRSSTTTETRYIEMHKDNIECTLLKPRQEGIICQIEHHDKDFYALTNDQGDNFRLIKIPINAIQTYIEILPHNLEFILNNFYIFNRYLVIEGGANGLSQLLIYKINDMSLQDSIKFNEPTYSTRALFTTYNSTTLRYEYSSLKTPKITYDYNFLTQEITILKKQTLSRYNPDEYEVLYERIKVPATYYGEKVIYNNPYLSGDITVPVSIIYKKCFSGPKPTLLYGYGSYGISIPSHFRASIFPLLDRGFAYAIAHIRGGGEMGEMWHKAGKMQCKKNTFEDFIKVAEYLKSTGYSSLLAISGGSAGGMLIGYCINKRPDLYQAAIAVVPFVDVLNTMLDDGLPLTPGEFKEWGNPIINQEIFQYIKSYSPYDNIRKQPYPHLYISSGLYDQRVTYWEPLKFIAKLREYKTDDNISLLKMNMNAGHAGMSGRFHYIEEIAQENLFLLTVFNIDKKNVDVD